MRRSDILQGIREIKFENVYGRYSCGGLSHAETGELLGVGERTSRQLGRPLSRRGGGGVAGPADRLGGQPRAGGRGAVKVNQPTLRAEVEAYFAAASPGAIDTYTEHDKGHGRIEQRTTSLMREVGRLWATTACPAR